MSTNFSISIPSKRLAVSILSTDMSFKLNNILSWAGLQDGATNLTASDFGPRAFGVFRNPTNTQMELFEWDPTTVASASITILARGLTYSGGFVNSGSTAYNWAANETIVELGTHTPQLFEYIKSYIDAAILGGGLDASTTVKGISKLSTAPASAVNPIAVGDNDGRVPTQGENDALVGSSGTPSSSNKYITADDVSDAAVSGKIVRATGTALPALDGANLTNVVHTQYAPVWKSGTFGKNAADASTTQNIAHGLGVAPKYVRITGFATSTNGVAHGNTMAVYNGTTQSAISIVNLSTGLFTSAAFELNSGATDITTQTGNITVDATNIIISWTKTGSPTGSYQLLWEAMA